MLINNNNQIRYHLPISRTTPNFKGIDSYKFEPLFDEFCHSVKIDDKELAKQFPGKLNIAKNFLELEGYNLNTIAPLKSKKQSEFKYLYEIASKKDLADIMRIPAKNISDFAALPPEKFKAIEPIMLSKRDIGIWNYEPEYILHLTTLEDKKLNTFIELAKCNVIPNSTRAILENTNINWDKTVEKAKGLKELYGKDLREVEFYSNSKGENFFLADIQLPHRDDKPDWQNYKRITVKLDDDVTPIARKKSDIHIESLVDNIYDTINTKLHIFSSKDLDNTINKVQDKCPEATEQEVLTTIQKLTQFSSYNAIKPMAEQLRNQGITEFGNIGESYKYFNYFHKRRELFSLNNSENKKLGVILTKNDISNEVLIKKLKQNKDNPVLKNIIFINLEGFSDGINLFSDNNKLTQLTSKTLTEAKKIQEKNNKVTFDECVSQTLNKSIETPLKQLGLNVYTVKFDNPATKASILDQMKPIMPNKDSITTTIESIAENYSANSNANAELSKSLAKYYNTNVNVYSKQSIIEDLKKINTKVHSYMEENNLPKENLYLIENELEEPKSYDIINKMYKDLFEIPQEKTIKLSEIADINGYPENSTFLILDDIAGTGQSMVEVGEYYRIAPYISKKQHVLFAPISSTEEGVNFINKHITDSSRENNDCVITLNENKAKNKHHKDILNNKLLHEAKADDITNPGHGEQALCTAFPYMAPDNNAYISANLVSLFLPSHKCIKSIPTEFNKIQEDSVYYNLFGQKKEAIEPSKERPKQQNLIKRIISFFYR